MDDTLRERIAARFKPCPTSHCPGCGRDLVTMPPLRDGEVCMGCRLAAWNAGRDERERLADRQAEQVATFALRRFLADL